MELHKRIKTVRRKANFTQAEIAQSLSRPLSSAAISLWESDDEKRRTEPSIPQLNEFCEKVDIPLNILVDSSTKTFNEWVAQTNIPSPKDEDIFFALTNIYKDLTLTQRKKLFNFAKKLRT